MSARPGPITIDHVAKAAGVSRQTVSRVINDGPNVKAEVRERIRTAINDLGYVPNLAARRMGGAKSYLILAINDRQRTLHNWQSGLGNDWVDQMLYGGMLTCEMRGYHLLFELVDTDPVLACKQLDRALSSLRPDGVILTAPHSENADLSALLQRRRTPFGRMGSTGKADGINVFMDDHAAAAAATRHLIDLGHRRIAFISGSADYAASDQRLDGYRDAIRDAGLDASDDYVRHGDFSFESGVAATEALLSLRQAPTAIIAGNDEMAFAVLHVANRHSVDVPGELSVISFDDTPGVRFSVPPLTAIRQPIADMAAKAAELLISATRGEAVSGDYALPFDLIQRSTTAAPRQ